MLDDPKTVVVLVTYGNRKKYVLPLLDALKHLTLDRIIVVDNGAQWPVTEALREIDAGRIEVFKLAKNLGSAFGFSEGIRRALEVGASYIWLLDDDTRPRSETLEKLRAAYHGVSVENRYRRLAVVAFRPEHQADVALGVSLQRLNPRMNSALGFHFLDVPFKIWRRTPWGNSKCSTKLPTRVALNAAPYGGLYFHRELIEEVGLPNAAMVLYADDTEFTYRITKSGGRIYLITEALIDDLESSWAIKNKFKSTFAGWLHGQGEFRAYYGMRNQVFVDATCTKNNSFAFFLNLSVYFITLMIMALCQGRIRRYRILFGAMVDGLRKHLGPARQFPLPGGAPES